MRGDGSLIAVDFEQVKSRRAVGLPKQVVAEIAEDPVWSRNADAPQLRY